MNPAKQGTKLHETISRRQVLEELGRTLIGDLRHEYSADDYQAIDDAVELLEQLATTNRTTPKRKRTK